MNVQILWTKQEKLGRFNQPTSKKGWPTNESDKWNKQNKMATKKEDYFLEFNEKKGNDVKWNFFEVDILIAIWG